MSLRPLTSIVASAVLIFLGLLSPRVRFPLMRSLLVVGPGPVRSWAVSQLEGLGEKTIPVLIMALEDPEPEVRVQAVYLLGEQGKAAVRALPALERLGKTDASFEVLFTVHFSLQMIAEDAKPQETPAALIPGAAPEPIELLPSSRLY